MGLLSFLGKIFLSQCVLPRRFFKKLKERNGKKKFRSHFLHGFERQASIKFGTDIKKYPWQKVLRVGGIDISADILEKLKNIEKMQDIQKMLPKALEGNKVHKISHLLEIILLEQSLLKLPTFILNQKKTKAGCASFRWSFARYYFFWIGYLSIAQFSY